MLHNNGNIICIDTDGIGGREVTEEETNAAMRYKNEIGGRGRATLTDTGIITKCIDSVTCILQKSIISTAPVPAHRHGNYKYDAISYGWSLLNTHGAH